VDPAGGVFLILLPFVVAVGLLARQRDTRRIRLMCRLAV
jgi:hypothetical protein